MATNGSRLRPPPGRPDAVLRSDLVARLLGAAGVRVVLLAAGAGFGKTTLLAQWAERDGRPFAWVSLDAADDDPAALLADVTEALGAAGRRGSAAVTAASRPFVLVLDDLHVLRAPESLALVSELADRLPAGSQLAIAGRCEPALPLARWCVRGDLLRIGAEQLAMGPAEAGDLLGADLDVPAGELDALVRRTEGWAAGLRMAGIRLREQRAAGRAGPGFAGHDRLVADYLRDEVLGPLGPEATRFLVDTSPLDRLSGPLCDAVLGRRGSAATLRSLERSNLFVRPVDGAAGWYRCHPLLSDMLRVELHLHDPALEVELHRRASRWHEAAGDPAEAIRHARAAGDAARVGDLVWAGLLPRLWRGERGAIEGWLADLDEAAIAAHPALALAAAWCRLERGDVPGCRRWAAIAEGAAGGPLPGGPASPAAAAAILRAHAAEDGLARMAEDAARGSAGDAAGSWCGLCALLEGTARRLLGDHEGARARLTTAEHLSTGAPSPRVRALAQLAALAADEGDWDGAGALVARARAAGARHRLDGDASAIELSAVSALVEARLGRPAEAASDARRCLRLLASAQHVPPWLAVDARVLLARASLLVGDAGASRARLREARPAAAGMPDAGTLPVRLAETWRKAEAFPRAGVLAPTALSRAELRVLRLLPTHLTYREIGERLHVSQCTVKSQALSAFRKLDVSSRSQVVERAGALGLLEAITAPGPIPQGGSGAGTSRR